MAAAVEPTTADLAPPEMASEIRKVEPWDFSLLTAVLALVALGTVLVYSARINEDSLSKLADGEHHLRIHLAHVFVALVALAAGAFFPYRALRRFVYPGLLLSIALLVMVMLFGKEAGNARRWLELPGFSVQPAEMAKLAFILFLAYSLEKKGERVRQFSVAFAPHLLVCAVLILLCLFQPDFGTCVLLVLLMFGMLFVAGTKIAYVGLFTAVGAFLVFQAIAMNDMRLGRVLAFIDPWAHRADRGYQMVNSLIAIGSGGLTGQSLGFGGQTLTGYLPEGHTDFILSVLAEQLGLVGVLAVVTLFVVVLVQGLRTALAARDEFGRFLAFGVTLLLGLQAVVNMLVAVALIPTKGLTLPFVSHGGSSMLVSCLGVGILLNIGRDVRWGRVEALDLDGDAPAGPRSSRPRGGRKSRRLFGLLPPKAPKQKPLDEVIG